MVKLVPNFVREAWHIWNIRGLVLTSFALQVCLFLFAPLRKRSNKSIVTWFVWSAYLFADYIATFCIGLIFDKRDTFSDSFVSSYILVFWAPFLLLHLGGPDTITAFALEDNELWLRHLLGLVFQVVATVYLFFLTIPGNPLWIPTTLVFFAGMIKYIERTRSLFLASMNALRKSIDDTRGTILEIDYAKNMELYFEGKRPSFMFVILGRIPPFFDQNAPHVELLRDALHNVYIFKWLLIDKTLDFDFHRHLLHGPFLEITAENALIVTEAELNFMYEFFFTKASVLWWNKVACLVHLASFISTVAALLVFVTQKKHDFNKLEIQVTYILLLGAVALDTTALLRLIFSDRAIITYSPGQSSAIPEKVIPKLAFNLKANLSKLVLKFRKPKWSKCKKEPYTEFHSLSSSLLFCKWSGTISGHDFIKCCLHKTKGRQSTVERSRVVVKFLKQRVHRVINYFGAEELVESWIYKANNPFLKELWEFIFEELKTKSRFAGNNKEIVDMICEATGEWVLEKAELDQQMNGGLMPYVNSDEVGSFGGRIMIWHIATGLCYYAYTVADQKYANHRCFSKLLSDYMIYLLVMEPSVISAAARIERTMILRVTSNLIDACGVVTKFPRMENQNHERFAQSECEAMINAFSRIDTDLKNKRGSLLIHACDLATKLRALLPEEKGWKTVAQIWVEMLSFVALNTKTDMHVQQLSKGGQLISFVWLLMLHMGLGGHQFQMIRRVRDKDSETSAAKE